MFVVDSPPHAQQLAVDAVVESVLPTQCPRLISTNEVDSIDTALEMSICRHVLIVTTRSAIVGEA